MPDAPRMNWPDRVVAYFAPAAALRRLQARAALAEFEAFEAAGNEQHRAPSQRRDDTGWLRSRDGASGRPQWNNSGRLVERAVMNGRMSWLHRTAPLCGLLLAHNGAARRGGDAMKANGLESRRKRPGPLPGSFGGGCYGSQGSAVIAPVLVLPPRLPHAANPKGCKLLTLRAASSGCKPIMRGITASAGRRPTAPRSRSAWSTTWSAGSRCTGWADGSGATGGLIATN